MTELVWRQGLCSEVRIRDHVLTIDSSRDEGGKDLGPAPTELFLAALGGCIMINISRIAKKMRIDLKNVRMEISGVKEHNELPSSFTELHVNVTLDTNTNDSARLKRLVRLAEENCTISNTLRKAVNPLVRLV
jgi:putative redox protein